MSDLYTNKIKSYALWIWSLFQYYWILVFCALCIVITANIFVVILSVITVLVLFKDRLLNLVKLVGNWWSNKPQ